MSRFLRLFATFALAAATFLPAAVQAAPLYVDHANKNYWTNTSAGLDFLDLNVTLNNSYETVVNRTKAGGDLAGWRLATNVESRALYGSFGDAMVGWNANNYTNAHLFFTLFGVADTYKTSWNNGNVTNYLNWNAIFDADQRVAHVALDRGMGWFDAYYGFSNVTLSQYSQTPQAALLVRQSNQVPEPGSIVLVAIALACMAAARKRKQA